MDFATEKPATIPGKLNPEEQKQFIETYKKLKETLKEDESIYFMDGVHPAHQAQCARGWIYRSEKNTFQRLRTKY